MHSCAWTPTGHLLLGTLNGRLLIVRHAAPPSGPTPTSWGATAASALPATLLYEAELERWNAGAVLHICFTPRHLLLVFECPDNKGGLALWLQEEAPYISTHVSLPTARVTAAALSPSRQLLAVQDANARTAIVTTAGSSQDYLEVVAEGHPGPLLGIGVVQGAPPEAGALVVSLDISGRVCAWSLQPNARISDNELAPAATLLDACTLGESAAGMAVHPLAPLTAIATTGGTVQLIDASALAGRSTSSSVLVQYSARALVPGTKKLLEWSPDGKLLAAADRAAATVTFMHRRPHTCRSHIAQLALFGSVTVPHIDTIRWTLDSSGRTAAQLVLHLAHGQFVILNAPTSPAAPPAKLYSFDALVTAQFCLVAPMVDFRVIPQASGTADVTVVGVALDRSLRRFILPLGGNTAGRRGTPANLGLVPLAMPDAEAAQACTPLQMYKLQHGLQIRDISISFQWN
jgi:hypothetical protein